GVDTNKFASASSAQYGPTFVYFGRFASHKGLDRLIDAFEVTARRLPKARLKLIGIDWDGTLPRLRERARSLPPGQIDIMTDLDDAAIADALGDCSFFVSASEYEGFGLALVEALSAGLLPLASRIP